MSFGDVVASVIEPVFEVQFRPGSYGFRPGRNGKNALREVDRLVKEGYTFAVDADLASYFETIPPTAIDASRPYK